MTKGRRCSISAWDKVHRACLVLLYQVLQSVDLASLVEVRLILCSNQGVDPLSSAWKVIDDTLRLIRVLWWKADSGYQWCFDHLWEKILIVDSLWNSFGHDRIIKWVYDAPRHWSSVMF